MTALAGFFLASKLHIYWVLLPTIAGTALVIAAACVLNNYLDRGLDAKMNRTKKRALVSGAVQPVEALVYGGVLGAVGFGILVLFTNWLVVWLNAAAIVSYVIFYGIAKRKSVHGTLVGSLPGALPPVIGYAAVSDRLDSGALILFLILVAWQMPHFYAIAMYRYRDYRAAGLPVLPVKLGMRAARRQILAYILAFTLLSSLLSVFGYTGYIFLAAGLAAGTFWFLSGVLNYQLTDEKWGRRMFVASLKVTVVLSLALAVGSRLP